jgi:hypothetical protein
MGTVVLIRRSWHKACYTLDRYLSHLANPELPLRGKTPFSFPRKKRCLKKCQQYIEQLEIPCNGGKWNFACARKRARSATIEAGSSGGGAKWNGAEAGNQMKTPKKRRVKPKKRPNEGVQPSIQAASQGVKQVKPNECLK